MWIFIALEFSRSFPFIPDIYASLQYNWIWICRHWIKWAKHFSQCITNSHIHMRELCSCRLLVTAAHKFVVFTGLECVCALSQVWFLGTKLSDEEVRLASKVIAAQCWGDTFPPVNDTIYLPSTTKKLKRGLLTAQMSTVFISECIYQMVIG